MIATNRDEDSLPRPPALLAQRLKRGLLPEVQFWGQPWSAAECTYILLDNQDQVQSGLVVILAVWAARVAGDGHDNLANCLYRRYKGWLKTTGGISQREHIVTEDTYKTSA